jgi:hypothetical protein
VYGITDEEIEMQNWLSIYLLRKQTLSSEENMREGKFCHYQFLHVKRADIHKIVIVVRAWWTNWNNDMGMISTRMTPSDYYKLSIDIIGTSPLTSMAI